MARAIEQIKNHIKQEQEQLSYISMEYHRKIQEARTANTGSVLSTNLAQGMLEDLAKNYYDEQRYKIETRITKLQNELKEAQNLISKQENSKQEKQRIAHKEQQHIEEKIKDKKHLDDLHHLAEQKERKFVPAGASAESLTERGFLFLEETKWEKASNYFDNALDLNPKYASAYIGLLCVELKLIKEDDLKKHNHPLTNLPNYEKAIRFADKHYRIILDEYNCIIEERIEEEKRIKKEERYMQLLNEKNMAEQTQFDSSVFYMLIDKFRRMNGYKNTEIIANECETRYLEHMEEKKHIAEAKRQREIYEQQENKYNQLMEEKNHASTIDKYRELANGFKELHGFKNADSMESECCNAIDKIINEKKENERKERERIIEEKRQQKIKERIKKDEIKKAQERNFINISEMCKIDNKTYDYINEILERISQYEQISFYDKDGIYSFDGISKGLNQELKETPEYIKEQQAIEQKRKKEEREIERKKERRNIGVILHTGTVCMYLLFLYRTDIIRNLYTHDFSWFYSSLPLILFTLIIGIISVIFLKKSDYFSGGFYTLVIIIVQTITAVIWKDGFFLFNLFGIVIANILSTIPGFILIFKEFDENKSNIDEKNKKSSL
jgi:hypothetical protein